MFSQQFRQEFFVNGAFSSLQGCAFLLVIVHQYNVVPDFSQTCPCYKTYIARADHCNVHGIIPLEDVFRR
jgi:hypothetical protein